MITQPLLVLDENNSKERISSGATEQSLIQLDLKDFIQERLNDAVA